MNDKDGFVTNFWRALAADPDEVAHHADWPVNEADLIARHLWLVTEGRTRLLNRLEADPEYFDAQIAGWWVWGACSWIGSGWCTGTGPWMTDDDGNMAKRPDDGGRGVNRQLPHLGDAGQGVNRQLPHLGNAGRGVNRQLPLLGPPRGVNRGTNADGLTAYMRTLAARLRLTRVCCGDWSRVVTMGALNYGPTVGVFLDPPYLGDVRASDLYASDDHTIAHEVREWCLENGDNPRYRIVLAGYSAEHDHLIPDTWRRHRYTADKAAYSTAASAARQDGNHTNRHGEVLWMSPHCERIGTQASLFGDVA